MTHADIIAALGGTRAVADALSLPRGTVHYWRYRAIPAVKWPDVARLAAASGQHEITVELLAASRPDVVSMPKDHRRANRSTGGAEAG